MTVRALTVPVFLASAVFLLHGCGYGTDSLIREDMGSVFIGYFENDTWRQGLEVEFRRALAREIKLHGGFRLSGRKGADSVIEGRILDYAISSVTRTAEDEILMKRITVGVSYRWLDGLSGRELVPWTELNRSVMLAAGHQEAEAERAFREVAQALVQGLERQW